MLTSTDPAGALTYTYTNNSDVDTIIDSLTGVTRHYTWDNAGRLNHETDTASTNTGTATGATRTYTYDAASRLLSDTTTSPAGALTAGLTYTYDAAANLTSTTTTGQLATPHQQRYTYDADNRLTREENTTTGDGTDYTWDGVGNRTTLARWSGGSSTRTPGSTQTGTPPPS